nr:CerR family C-terminal domain-containing protein [uncultured Duganella sp.]
MNAKATSPTTTASSQPADDVRKPRSDGEQSRERLLVSAMRLFGQQGFSKTSTREIAQAAGTNVAAISYYFGDKAGLYRACFTFMCAEPGTAIAAFDQPHFTLRESLQGYYGQMMAPLLHQKQEADVMLRLFFREMLEPTGLWTMEVENNIKPEHLALVRVLCRHLGLAEATDDVHRLAYSVPALCIQLMISQDVINAITPHMVSTPEAISAWGERLVDYAEALFNAEKLRLQRKA